MLQYIYQLKSPQVFIVEILGKGLWLEAEMSLASISVGRIVIWWQQVVVLLHNNFIKSIITDEDMQC